MPALQFQAETVRTVGPVAKPVWEEGVVHLAIAVGQAVQPWLVDRATLVKERLVRQQEQERVDGSL